MKNRRFTVLFIILLFHTFLSFCQDSNCEVYIKFDSLHQNGIDDMNEFYRTLYQKHPKAIRYYAPQFLINKLDSVSDYPFYKKYFASPPNNRLDYFILMITGGYGEQFYVGSVDNIEKPQQILQYLSPEMRNEDINIDSYLVLFEINTLTNYPVNNLGIYQLGYLNYVYTPDKLRDVSHAIKTWKEVIEKKDFYYAKDSSSFNLTLSHLYNTKIDIGNLFQLNGVYTNKAILEMYVSFPVCKRIAVLPCLLENLELEEQLVDLFQTDLNTLTESTTPQFYKNGVLDKKKLQIAIDIWKTKIECSF